METKKTVVKPKYVYFVIYDDKYGSGDSPDAASSDYYEINGDTPALADSLWYKATAIEVKLKEVVSTTLVATERGDSDGY